MTGDRRHLLERDQEARELAHTEFETPLIIEAGAAGTEKLRLPPQSELEGFQIDRREALSQLKRAIEHDPDLVEAYINMGNVLRQQGQSPVSRLVEAEGLNLLPPHVGPQKLLL
jgi:tetratricopeptide (TPR) repeat protein